MRSVLVAVVLHARETCTIAFCASLLKLQVQLARRQDLAVAIDFVADDDAAWAAFAKTEADTMVVIDSHAGISPDFVLEPLETDEDCVIAPYPLRGIDWDRVTRVLEDPQASEPPDHAGLRYNVALDRMDARGRVPLVDVAEMRVAKFRRGAPRRPSPIRVDLAHPAQSFGIVAFTGCVGHRRVLR